MALRSLCSRVGQQRTSVLQTFVESRRWQSSPTVFDKLVDILVFDTQGHRHTLRGRQGQTLVELLADNEAIIGEGVVGLSPEGRGIMEALVTVPNDYLEQIPAPDAQDLRALEELSPTGAAVSKNARLASKIKLTAALNDVHIALSPLQPWKTL
ncbi:g12665 [Coccomyxa viridis]|uniref:G12665 protein n=1 Tax=Coccomyxa viridis TaxID=1274662 RepID=A0ABP1GAW3_9CHLO